MMGLTEYRGHWNNFVHKRSIHEIMLDFIFYSAIVNGYDNFVFGAVPDGLSRGSIAFETSLQMDQNTANKMDIPMFYHNVQANEWSRHELPLSPRLVIGLLNTLQYYNEKIKGFELFFFGYRVCIMYDIGVLSNYCFCVEITNFDHCVEVFNKYDAKQIPSSKSVKVTYPDFDDAIAMCREYRNLKRRAYICLATFRFAKFAQFLKQSKYIMQKMRGGQ